MKALRSILAIAIGLVVGTALWVVFQVVVHGTCGINIRLLHELLCSAQPGIGGEITSQMTGEDLLGLPFAWGISIFFFWKLIYQREKLKDIFD